ncbi:rab GTPase-activating protein 1-like isoform X1 [Anopheles aquasalis]|uniref:rab GTPase-activating protein 1-like isoform X1 n=1 Tax=Anopheles aquasalis TaxID=42839 RepID=UPI00215A852F|nr:rab GTPase-activating protein 1-like isoform X1 [Anopheles aquasalis]
MEQQQSGQSSDTKTSAITEPSSAGLSPRNAREETTDRPVTNSSPPAATTTTPAVVGDASSPSSPPSALGSKSDDNLSIKSSDSVTTSGEYEIVPEAPLETLLDAATEGPERSEQEVASNIADLAECIAEGKVGGSGGTSKVLKTAISPILNIEGDGNMMDLEKNMNEVIHELDEERTLSGATDPSSSEKATPVRSPAKPGMKSSTSPSKQAKSATTTATSSKPQVPTSLQLSLQSLRANATDTPTPNMVSPVELGTGARGVGQSVFYDCIDSSPMTEKKDDMKPEVGERSDETDEELSDIDQDCTIFSGVTYLGASRINAPKSEREILQKVSEMNTGGGGTTSSNRMPPSLNGGNESPLGLKVSVSIPNCSEGLVVLYDCESHSVVATYEVQRILFFARGPVGSVDQACFAFTWSHGESQDTAVHQCHVFRCNIPEAVTQVSTCFAKAFQRALPPSVPVSMSTSLADSGLNVMLASVTSDTAGNPIQSAMYEFAVSLEIKEKERNGYVTVPRDVKSSFRLRCKTDKEVCITVRQVPSEQYPPLLVERCFGVLLSPGKIVRQADMQLLDMVSMGYVKPPEGAGNATSAAPMATTTGATTGSSSSSSNNAIVAANFSQFPYQIKAEWKANAFEPLNMETPKKALTVAVDLVIKGIQEPVRFVIETSVSILSGSELRIVQNLFNNKRPLLLHFYLTLRENGEGTWEVDSIDHSDEIVDPPGGVGGGGGAASSLSLNFNFRNWSFKNSASVQSMQEELQDDSSPTDYSSDGDEPLLSGTGEVSKNCSIAQLDEWQGIILEWYQDVPEKRPKALAALVRSGIPEALRGSVWQRLACVENRTEMFDSYRVLITKETSCETVIQRDINRTFPAHKFFKENGGTGQENLYKVSKAYAVYDTEVGYCQGLSFIAASLLLHMPEEEAFCVLVALMYNYGLRDMYKMGFESLYLRLYQLNRLMKDQLPDLYEHFAQMGVESHMFASQWFLSLFTARFPLYFVFYILDVFLLDGIPVLFQVALTLLSTCRKDLLELDFEGILKYFRVTLPKKCRSETQAKRLMKLSFECKVKKLRKYELEYMAKKEETERKEQELKQYEQRYGEERAKLQHEISTLNEKVEQMVREDRKSAGIIQDYKHIIQRQETENGKLHTMLDELTKTVSTCSKCSSSIPRSSPLHASYGRNLQQANSVNNNVHNQTNHPSEDQLDGGGGGGSDQNNSNAVTAIRDLGPLDPLVIATQRIRELELELAQTKLAQVEAECKNQDLLHQLNTAATELQATRSSWQPWLSKTLNSIQEKVATKRDVQQPGPTFQSYAASDAMMKNYPASQTNSNLPSQQLRSNTKAPLTQRHSLACPATVPTSTSSATVEEDEVTRRAKYDSSVNVLYKDTRCNSLK